jgi:hypothetical protein
MKVWFIDRGTCNSSLRPQCFDSDSSRLWMRIQKDDIEIDFCHLNNAKEEMRIDETDE